MRDLKKEAEKQAPKELHDNLDGLIEQLKKVGPSGELQLHDELKVIAQALIRLLEYTTV